MMLKWQYLGCPTTLSLKVEIVPLEAVELASRHTSISISDWIKLFWIKKTLFTFNLVRNWPRHSFPFAIEPFRLSQSCVQLDLIAFGDVNPLRGRYPHANIDDAFQLREKWKIITTQSKEQRKMTHPQPTVEIIEIDDGARYFYSLIRRRSDGKNTFASRVNKRLNDATGCCRILVATR